jgi:hypothetical protein
VDALLPLKRAFIAWISLWLIATIVMTIRGLSSGANDWWAAGAFAAATIAGGVAATRLSRLYAAAVAALPQLDPTRVGLSAWGLWRLRSPRANVQFGLALALLFVFGLAEPQSAGLVAAFFLFLFVRETPAAFLLHRWERSHGETIVLRQRAGYAQQWAAVPKTGRPQIEPPSDPVLGAVCDFIGPYRPGATTGLLAAWLALAADSDRTRGIHRDFRRRQIHRLEVLSRTDSTAVVDLEATVSYDVDLGTSTRAVFGARYDGPVWLRYEDGRWRIEDITNAGRRRLSALRPVGVVWQESSAELRVPFVLLGADGVAMTVDVRNHGAERLTVTELRLGTPTLWWRWFDIPVEPALVAQPGERATLAFRHPIQLPENTASLRLRVELHEDGARAPIDVRLDLELKGSGAMTRGEVTAPDSAPPGT